MTTTTTAAIIESGSHEYTYSSIFVVTYPDAAYARTTAQLVCDMQHAAQGYDVEPPVSTLYVNAEGTLRPVKFKSLSGRFDSDDYADVTGEIQDAETGAVIARYGYRIDGRA